MATERKAFMPIDIDDTKLERLAQEKGVATMVKPAPEATERPKPQVRRAPEPKVDPESIPTPRDRLKNVSLEIPDYVWKELKVRALHRGVTVKHVIMTSLKLEGFEIRDADMIEDGRQNRGGHGAG